VPTATAGLAPRHDPKPGSAVVSGAPERDVVRRCDLVKDFETIAQAERGCSERW
jgi:hypothetical protein